ncbi:MAG: glycosyltransferase [Proteobacteria bacterium]|nr:glycosyltransferase [Desulfobulbaceae bacterium]MBU4152815.1 glycosyltransferase [Pseudomonadota bacterium]
MTNPRLGIVIPVYNEGESIGRTLDAVAAQVATPHRISLVYDFDEDNTLAVVQSRPGAGSDIRLIKNPRPGVVSALKTGLRQAEEEYVLVTMADMSDDYADVDTMCRLMDQGYDLVCGSRYMGGGRQFGGPVFKKVLSRLAGITLCYLARIPTSDATNSFKLYRKRMLDALSFESDGGFEIGMEIVVKAHALGYKVTEIPTCWTDRTAGTSRFRLIRWAPYYLRWYLAALRYRLWP